MRKLLSYLLIAALIFPWANTAQAASTDPMSADHPAFATLLQQVQKADSAGINYLITDLATNTTSMKNTKTTSLSDAQGLQSNGQLAAGCNPVVWAAMVQKAQNQMVRDANLAVEAHNQTPASMNNKCTTKLGADGSDRSAVDQAVRNQTEAIFSAMENAICTLNFTGLIKGLVGGSISVCKNGKVFSSNLNQTLGSTFLANGQDPFKSKDCAQPTSLNSNLMQNASGKFGAAALNGSSSGSLGYSTAGAVPTGSSRGWTLGIGVGGGNNGLGVTTQVGNTTSTTNIVGTGSSSVPSSVGGGTPTPIGTPATTTTPTPSNTGAQNIYK